MKFQLYPKGRRAWIRLGITWGVILILAVGFGVYLMDMPGKSYRGALKPLTAEEKEIRDGLKTHVAKLAGEIGIRNVAQRPKSLDQAAAYIEKTFRDLGYTPADQRFTAEGREVRNIEVATTTTSHKNEILVIGAHYDTEVATPGADDNTSGVAGVLELARLFRGKAFPRPVRLVAFVNEETPYFCTEAMGSYRYARRCQERGENVVGMMSLETIAYYSDQPESQNYPPPFNLFYPSTGNFIGFVGNIASRAFVRQVVGAFRRQAQFPAEGTAAPEDIPGIGWSDHWAFWQFGYPALMVTDTAPFRNPHYHQPTDTPATLDYERTARVVAGLARVIEELAQGTAKK
jgi:hypothetical protein